MPREKRTPPPAPKPEPEPKPIVDPNGETTEDKIRVDVTPKPDELTTAPDSPVNAEPVKTPLPNWVPPLRRLLGGQPPIVTIYGSKTGVSIEAGNRVTSICLARNLKHEAVLAEKQTVLRLMESVFKARLVDRRATPHSVTYIYQR